MRFPKLCTLLITVIIPSGCVSSQSPHTVAQNGETKGDVKAPRPSDAPNTSKVADMSIKTISSSYKISSLRFSPDGATLAVGYEISTAVDLWRTANWTKKYTLQSSNDLGTFETSLSFSPVNSHYIAIGNGAKVRVWDTSNGKLIRAIEPIVGGPTLGLYRVSWSKDGKILATALKNKISLWDSASWTLVRAIEVPASISSLNFSSDNQQFAVGCYDFTVKLFDTASGKPTRLLQKGLGSGFIGVNTVVVFSPNGILAAPAPIPAARKTVKHDLARALAKQNQPIRLWDSRRGTLIRTFKGQPIVRAIAFSPDGRTMATGGVDSLINLWDVGSGELLHTFEGHKGAINSLTFSPGGKTLASGSSDMTIKIWHLP